MKTQEVDVTRQMPPSFPILHFFQLTVPNKDGDFAGFSPSSFGFPQYTINDEDVARICHKGRSRYGREVQRHR